MNKQERRTFRAFTWASFLNDFGSDAIYPIWPLFVTTVLGANMAVLGFIDGLGEAIVSISQAVSGYLSDRIRKRKVFIWIGYLCAVISRLGYALSLKWQHLIPFRILDRAGKIRGAPRDAVVADISVREDRGRNFGLLRAMDNLGAVCGILFCVLFFKILGYRNLFLLASLPSAFSILLIIFFVKEERPSDTQIYQGFSAKNLSWNFRLLFLLSAIFALGNFSYSFLLIYAKSSGFKVGFIPLLYLVFTAIAFLVSLPFGKIADKIGRKPILALSFLLWGLVAVSFVSFRNYWSIILGFILYGLHKGALEPVQKTLVSELAPREYRASVLGLFQMVIGICALPASLIAGLLWDKIDMAIPFYLSLGLTASSIVMLMFVKEGTGGR